MESGGNRMLITGCEGCTGFCSRHNIYKPSTYQRLCQTNLKYFQAWEEGRGPEQLTRQVERLQGPRYNHWGSLHYYAVEHQLDWNPKEAKRFFCNWQRAIPSVRCTCKDNWKKLQLKPIYTTPRDFFDWAWFAHDLVNQKLLKAYRPTLEESYGIWGFRT